MNQLQTKPTEIKTDAASEVKAKNLRLAAGLTSGAALAGTAIIVSEQPSYADDPISQISTTVTSLGTLAGAALAVALVPFGIFFAFKIVKGVLAKS